MLSQPCDCWESLGHFSWTNEYLSSINICCPNQWIILHCSPGNHGTNIWVSILIEFTIMIFSTHHTPFHDWYEIHDPLMLTWMKFWYDHEGSKGWFSRFPMDIPHSIGLVPSKKGGGVTCSSPSWD
jgi:hypothetical protein